MSRRVWGRVVVTVAAATVFAAGASPSYADDSWYAENPTTCEDQAAVVGQVITRKIGAACWSTTFDGFCTVYEQTGGSSHSCTLPMCVWVSGVGEICPLNIV